MLRKSVCSKNLEKDEKYSKDIEKVKKFKTRIGKSMLKKSKNYKCHRVREKGPYLLGYQNSVIINPLD